METCKEAEDVQLALLLALERRGKEPHITLLVDAGSVNGRYWSAHALLSLRSRRLVVFVTSDQNQLATDETWINTTPVRLTVDGRALAREIVAELSSWRPIESNRVRTVSQGPMDDATNG